MFEINTDFLINQLTTYFYTRHLTPLIHLKKTRCALYHRIFWKYPLINTSLLFFKVDEVFNISNKYRPLSYIPKH